MPLVPTLTRHRPSARRPLALALLGAVLASALGGGSGPGASAAVTATRIASDPFTQATCKGSATTNHRANVEPDSFSYGSTIVVGTQVGRIYDGGACAIGWATSSNDGADWTSGLLPSITKWTTPAGPWDRATDPAIAYDARHGVWLISTLAFSETSSAMAILTSTSGDGGRTWGTPIVTSDDTASPDKNWIACDNTASSPFYGRCYTQWDDNGAGNKMYMKTSTDGGLTWGPKTSNGASIIGGQPLVRPDGIVMVPTANGNETAIGSFSSTDGGTTWSGLTTITTVSHHRVAGSLREGPLPSAEVDGAGKVYVVWSDCRFRNRCKTNDIVLVKSSNSTGTSWTAPVRIPLDPTGSGIDHFIPGLAVDRTTSGSTARLALTYYFYPQGSTSLSVGFTSSTDGGSTWSAPQTVMSGMPSTWAPTTSQGRMVGDYISSSFGSDGRARGIFTGLGAPTTGGGTRCSATLDNCDAATYVATPSVVAAAVVGVAADPIRFANPAAANSGALWRIIDSNGINHRR